MRNIQVEIMENPLCLEQEAFSLEEQDKDKELRGLGRVAKVTG